MEKPALVWIRNDLRFHDNPAIFEAVSRHKQVVLVYIYDADSRHTSPLGSASRVWLERALGVFGEKARSKGFGWIIREGNSLDVLRDMVRELGSGDVFWNRRYEQECLQQDGEVEEMLSMDGIRIYTFQGNLLIEPWKVMTKKGGPFQVFTPFLQAFGESGLNLCEAPDVSPFPWRGEIFSLSPQTLPLSPRFLEWPKQVLSGWPPGEEGALELLESFCLRGLLRYEEDRNFPSIKGTSMLSPYLHSGEISARRVWNMILAHGRKARRFIGDPFLRELVWREFSYYILYHFPHTVREPFKVDRKITWREDKKELRAWWEGQTGIPFVDAGMKQLWETGWMHNRVRMISASFLIKHLLHSWKEGMAWFWDTLVDADSACNTYNWQNMAGCGAGAPPFFRIFNPVVQAKRFDPEGLYVKKYLPVLKHVPPAFIHTPWEAPMNDLVSWGVHLGKNYPWPLVDLDVGRKRALEAYAKGP